MTLHCGKGRGVGHGNRCPQGGSSAPAASFDPASLFASSEIGDYWDFTDATTLAVNADGSGGSPAVGAACKWAAGKRGVINLRNTVTSVTRRAGGIETDGVGYGLFCMAGFGWTLGDIARPFEIAFAMRQLAFAGTDARLFSSGSIPLFMLQGTTSGKVRWYDGGYGTEVDPGLNTDFTIDAYLNANSSTISLNGGPMQASSGAGQSLDGFVIGSNGNSASPTNALFKRGLLINRALTTPERASVQTWLAA